VALLALRGSEGARSLDARLLSTTLGYLMKWSGLGGPVGLNSSEGRNNITRSRVHGFGGGTSDAPPVPLADWLGPITGVGDRRRIAFPSTAGIEINALKRIATCSTTA